MKTLITETRSELITKIIRTLSLKSNEIGEIVELYYDVQHLRIAHANKERTEPPSGGEAFAQPENLMIFIEINPYQAHFPPLKLTDLPELGP